MAWIVVGVVISGVSGAASSGSPTTAGVDSVVEPADNAPVSEATEEAAVEPTAEPAMVLVPDLTGQTASAAVATLRSAGFDVPDAESSDTTVTVTDPAMGTTAANGITVTLTIEAKPRRRLPQENAVGKAQSYLDYQAFSRSGLIEQLQFEGYSTDDATFAVDYIAADWNEQAGRKAKSYLEYRSFSREGLYEQLIFEGYSEAEVNAGLAAVRY